MPEVDVLLMLFLTQSMGAIETPDRLAAEEIMDPETGLVSGPILAVSPLSRYWFTLYNRSELPFDLLLDGRTIRLLGKESVVLDRELLEGGLTVQLSYPQEGYDQLSAWFEEDLAWLEYADGRAVEARDAWDAVSDEVRIKEAAAVLESKGIALDAGMDFLRQVNENNPEIEANYNHNSGEVTYKNVGPSLAADFAIEYARYAQKQQLLYEAEQAVTRPPFELLLEVTAKTRALAILGLEQNEALYAASSGTQNDYSDLLLVVLSDPGGKMERLTPDWVLDGAFRVAQTTPKSGWYEGPAAHSSLFYNNGVSLSMALPLEAHGKALYLRPYLVAGLSKRVLGLSPDLEYSLGDSAVTDHASVVLALNRAELGLRLHLRAAPGFGIEVQGGGVGTYSGRVLTGERLSEEIQSVEGDDKDWAGSLAFRQFMPAPYADLRAIAYLGKTRTYQVQRGAYLSLGYHLERSVAFPDSPFILDGAPLSAPPEHWAHSVSFGVGVPL